jgi:hypothetical protein
MGQRNPGRRGQVGFVPGSTLAKRFMYLARSLTRSDSYASHSSRIRRASTSSRLVVHCEVGDDGDLPILQDRHLVPMRLYTGRKCSLSAAVSVMFHATMAFRSVCVMLRAVSISPAISAKASFTCARTDVVQKHGAEIWNELREDVGERLAVFAHQRIGRCVRQLEATSDRALVHQLRTHAGLVDQRELHDQYRRGTTPLARIAVQFDDRSVKDVRRGLRAARLCDCLDRAGMIVPLSHPVAQHRAGLCFERVIRIRRVLHLVQAIDESVAAVRRRDAHVAQPQRVWAVWRCLSVQHACELTSFQLESRRAETFKDGRRELRGERLSDPEARE